MKKGNNKNNEKGFTLIELLVVVLIIGILSSIALPSYTRAVEKSRTANPLANLSAIAKAQKVRKLATYHYTNNMNNLDISLTDELTGERATGDGFNTEYFSYKVYGDDRAVATATRRNASGEKQYELSVNYDTDQLFCRPATDKTCMDLNLAEGQDNSQVPWNNCSSSMDHMGISCYTRDNDGVTENARCGYTFWDYNTGYHNPMCSIESEQDGITTNKGCRISEASEGFCQSYAYMYQYGPQGNRDCLDLNGDECNAWSDWYFASAS